MCGAARELDHQQTPTQVGLIHSPHTEGPREEGGVVVDITVIILIVKNIVIAITLCL